MESPPAENRDRLNIDEKTVRVSSISNGLENKKRIFFETKSLAEVYAKQGHISVALEIYRRMKKRNPSDDQIEKRISELKSQVFAKRRIKSKEQDE